MNNKATPHTSEKQLRRALIKGLRKRVVNTTPVKFNSFESYGKGAKYKGLKIN